MDTPFAHMLHTNTVPSDEQCGDIHTFLTSPRQQLAELNKEVARLQRLLEETIGKRDQIKVFIDAHLALVSPVRRLPDDMLRAIFCETLPATRNSALSPREGPLLLGQISKLWRSIALTTPRVWASMYIVIPGQEKMDRLIGLVQTWLCRSGNVPLAISVAPSRAWTTDCDVSALFALLISAANRWKSIQITLPQRSEESSLSGLRPQDVPLLESLKIFTYGFYPPGTDFENLDKIPVALLAAPTLTNLHFQGPPVDIPSHVSWANLRCLTFVFVGTHPFNVTLLKECPALHYLRIFLDGAHLQYLDSPHRISLPRLSSLSLITYTQDSEDQQLFKYLSLPVLQSLELQPSSPDLTWLQDYAHTLTRLKFDVYSLVSNTVVEALASLPNLEELSMVGEPIASGDLALDQTIHCDPDFLMRLSPYLNAAPVLPLLHRFEFGNLRSTLDDDILTFIRARTSLAARANNVASLRRALFLLGREKVRDLEYELRDAVASGLSLSVSYSGAYSISYSPLEGVETTATVPMGSDWNGRWH